MVIAHEELKTRTFGVDEDEIHLVLIGHAGVGKTSFRRHLKDELFDKNEPPTIMLESKCMVIEDESKFKANKISINCWDTGGHPIFQDLLPCFARLMCLYGIVFRLIDINDFDAHPKIRPYNKDPNIYISPFTNREIMYRNLAFIHVYTSEMQNPSNPSATNFPGAVLIGTFKDELSLVSQDLINELNDDIERKACNNEWPIYPVSQGSSTYIHKIDNTISGMLNEDQDICFLKKTLSKCAHCLKSDSEWKSFKIALQRKCTIDAVCVMPLTEAIQIGVKLNVKSPQAALKYYHELGIFMWYHLSKREGLHGFVVIKPKIFFNIFSKVFCLDSESIPSELESLFMRGIVTGIYFNKLLKNNASNINNQWFVDFLEEHYLTSKVYFDDHGICYFIPSLLCIKSDYKEKTTKIVSDISPLYIVPQSGYIATGTFTRLLTALSAVWKIPLTDEVNEVGFCRNQYIFEVYSNKVRNVNVILSEFSKFIRIDCVPNSNIDIDEDVYFQIALTLEVQLQRIVPLWMKKKGFNMTFDCKNNCSTEIHFFSNDNILFESTDKMLCSSENSSFLHSSQKKWCRNRHLQDNGK